MMLSVWLFVFAMSARAAVGSCSGVAVLNDYERGTFMSASYGMRPEVAVQVLAADDCGPRMIESLRKMGARIRFADPKVGYALIAVRKEHVLDVLDIPGVAHALAASTEGAYALIYQTPPAWASAGELRAAPVPPFAIPFPRVATTLSKDGPYFPAADAGLTALWQRHPEADGRGVRVAVFDRGFDLLHPALQRAKDANGAPVPKIADVISMTTPEEDAGWVRLGDPIQTASSAFVASGRTWTAPYDGRFRFGLFMRELHLGSWDPSRPDPHIQSVRLSVGTLWDEETNQVWVDTDGDGSFRNQRPLGDFAETHAIDFFGQRQGEDDHRIPFGIKIDRTQRAVYLSIADSPHGGHIAGPLAANRYTGGLFDGAAPAAQLIDARQPAQNIRLAAALSAMARSDVDVINSSGLLGVPGNAQENFFRHVIERGVRVYDKPVACYCGVPNTLYVLDYQSPEMLRRNRQLPPPYGEALNGGTWFSDDGLVNTVVAPSTSLVTESRYMPVAIRWPEDGRLHVTDTATVPPAPAGYGIGANPSPTIAVVSGILADLVSEAKRMQVRYNAARLTQAVLTGTTRVGGFASSVQGFGLVNAARAWDQLVKMSSADDLHNPVLTSFALTRVKDGRRAEVHGFQADFSEAAGTVEQELWITRHGGYAGARRYTFSLRGDDGTYSLRDREARLVRDEPARLRFSVRRAPGLHVALLQLIDAEAAVVMAEVPLSVRAPDLAEPIAPGVDRYTATIPPLRLDNQYIRLETDTQAARFRMRIPYTGTAMLSHRSMPGFIYGVVGNRFIATQPPTGAPPIDALHHVGPMEEFESLVPSTEPATHTVTWENRGRPEYATPYDEPAPDVPITGTVTVTRYAVAFANEPGGRLRVTNTLAAVEGRLEWYDAKVMASLLSGEGPHAAAAVPRQLPGDVAQWRISVSSTSSSEDVADVFVLNCTDKSGACTVPAQRPLGASRVTLTLDRPVEGSWKIVVRTRARTSTPHTYHIRETWLVPNTSTQAADETYASGQTWTVPVPPTRGDTRYVAFRISGSPAYPHEKDGLIIAMTPLAMDLPYRIPGFAARTWNKSRLFWCTPGDDGPRSDGVGSRCPVDEDSPSNGRRTPEYENSEAGRGVYPDGRAVPERPLSHGLPPGPRSLAGGGSDSGDVREDASTLDCREPAGEQGEACNARTNATERGSFAAARARPGLSPPSGCGTSATR